MDTKTLTAADIDKLEAGRELDALVEMYVMYPYLQDTFFWPQKEPGVFQDMKADGFVYKTANDYSTNMEAAWWVVEHLCVGDLAFRLTYGYGAAGGCIAYFEAKISENYEAAYGGQAPTAPLAICRAALKYVLTSEVRA